MRLAPVVIAGLALLASVHARPVPEDGLLQRMLNKMPSWIKKPATRDLPPLIPTRGALAQALLHPFSRTSEVKLPTAEEIRAAGYTLKSTVTPTKVGKWFVLGRLGEGSFGYVDLGYDGKEYVAIKTIKPNAPKGPELQHEMAMQWALRNIDAVVKLHGRIEQDGKEGIVMEAANAGDLVGYAKAHPKPNVAEIKALFKELAAGLAKIHEAGIVLRDVKPENVLLFSKEGVLHAKFADFGLASKFDERHDELVGTPLYLPTAAYTGKPFDLAKADVYALGLTLFTVLHPIGELPRTPTPKFSPNWPYGWYVSEFDFDSDEFERIEKQFPDVVKLLTGMLEPEESKRFTAKQVLEDAWLK